MIARLAPRSLYARMLLIAAGATLVALAVAGVVIAAILGRFVVEGLDRRLDAEVLLLASTVGADGRINRLALGERVAAFDAGPGWRWRIEGPDGTIGPADFPALQAGPLPPAAGGPPSPPAPHVADPQPLDGQDAQGMVVHARRIMLQTPRGPVTVTAAAPREVVERPIRGAVLPLLAALAALAALLTAALLVQLRIGLRPLQRLRGEVAELRTGRRARVSETLPSELQPLAAELNAFAAEGAAALATARATAANLAHALKTPVATLAIDTRGSPSLAAQVGRIDRTIRHHLARARAAAVNRRTATPLRPAVDDVVAVIARLHDARALAIDVDVAPDLAVAVDAQDLDELLGNLLDNAARHAAGRIGVSAVRVDRHVRLVIADDGSGIPPSQRARVAEPGIRIDERGDGHGFGLAIVAELTALYGGEFNLDEVPGGGLAAGLTLPTAS